MFFPLLFYVTSAYLPRRVCGNMTFCRENLNKHSSYHLQTDSILFQSNIFTAHIKSDDSQQTLKIILYFITNIGFRFRVEPTEKVLFKRFDLSNESLIINSEILNQKEFSRHTQYELYSMIYGFGKETAKIFYNPFKIVIESNEKEILTINSDNFLLFNNGNKIPEEIYDGYVDNVPNGDTSVSLDFSFPQQTFLSGFGCRPKTMNLEEGIFRMFNFGGFANYGAIPFFIAHSSSLSVNMASVFWINPTDTFIETKKTHKNVQNNLSNFENKTVNISKHNYFTGNNMKSNANKIRFLSEGGYIDTVISFGNFKKLMSSYTDLTGKPAMPPIYGFGYHQSRWGYKSQQYVEEVSTNLENAQIPFDVFWLDIDHLKGNAPFTIDDILFPKINEMFQMFKDKNRYVVRITDPHIHIKHKLAKEFEENNLLALYPNNNSAFHGICWPGESVWPDFLNPKARKWWAHQFTDLSSFPENVMIWNDMNEPSISKSIDGSFPKSVLHFDSFENREIHNIYGFLNTAATFQGLLERNSNERPFILSRSHFSGSQKHVWVWSGDNVATWDDLAISVVNTINFGLSGFPFVGSDIGGHYGNPSERLLLRWFQVAAWTSPFFREHSHIECQPREPYLYKSLQKPIIDHYKLLPVFYTAAKIANETGFPIVRPLWTEYPEFPMMHFIQDQVLVADSLLVCPILREIIDEKKETKLIPPPGLWYDFFNGEAMSAQRVYSLSDENIPVFLRGGRIVLTYSDVGATVNKTLTKPLTLHVALDESQCASGDVYFDDGHTFNFMKGEYFKKHFSFGKGILKMRTISRLGQTFPEYINDLKIDKIKFYGLQKKPELDFNGKIEKVNELWEIYDVNFSILGDFTLFDGYDDSGVKVRSFVFKGIILMLLISSLLPLIFHFLPMDKCEKKVTHHSSDDPLIGNKLSYGVYDVSESSSGSYSF
ncbi:Neutral alpha-glucosidase AB [Tritrichomonas foetus]|uniref:Maltase n=1 Tax=Tritrichomonas foetus TaxID=1144522 RepID=A0A1J4JNW4_9EUKA|nr:Neutral alpha-glucosidase AB [Tritrichomonas foetus]|eukprot:OHT00096.1 Neutral alpha-glucosidase AB [Tritrichomonas foetus]